MSDSWTVHEIAQIGAVGLVLALQALKLYVGDQASLVLQTVLVTLLAIGWAVAVMIGRSNRLATERVKSILESEVDEFNAQ